ncbi:hypothetical protein NSK_000592 [Nannochloropsis salina CCMP1776]|uniref:Uncharacterized protein n=1 Tax=Nannochloropsis salina CCMP1776 TaxID=1027361 RepID=A0A4D9D9G2_9STRA|nr:hypothetical protein NSK_000592 [Nannochloropsis salina CCMP1776]|eukprot:TFJ88242.1 hypothetical protein NSK_000592 [Nannochloropsis salina CCMP1776]
MEALKEKAELAELNAKKQRKIALKALRARRLAEKQTVMINQDKERVESALRDSVEAHERLSRKFQHAVSTKLKVESQLRKARKIENVVDQAGKGNEQIYRQSDYIVSNPICTQ